MVCESLTQSPQVDVAQVDVPTHASESSGRSMAGDDVERGGAGNAMEQLDDSASSTPS